MHTNTLTDAHSTLTIVNNARKISDGKVRHTGVVVERSRLDVVGQVLMIWKLGIFSLIDET